MNENDNIQAPQQPQEYAAEPIQAETASTRKRGKVNNFGFLSDDGIRFIIDDLRLKMSPVHMRICVTHYKEVERRNPSIDELYFIDNLISSYGRRADNIAISSVKTESAPLYEAFRDLEHKHHALANGSASRPMSYSEMMSVGFKMTDALGKPSILEENETVQHADIEDMVSEGVYDSNETIHNTSFRYATQHSAGSFSPRANDIAILIYQSTPSDTPNRMYTLISEAVRRGILRVSGSLARTSVTCAMLKLFEIGTFVAFDAFPQGMFTETDELSSPWRHEFYVARISRKAYDQFKADATRLGFHTCIVGYHMSRSVFTVGDTKKNVHFSIDRRLLERLDLLTVSNVELSCPQKSAVHTQYESVEFNKYCGHRCTVSSAAPYSEVLTALLDGIGLAIERGSSLEEIELCAHLRLPVFNSESYAKDDHLCFALACYKLTSELALNGSGSASIDTDISSPCLDALFYYKKEAAANRAMKATDGSIYLLAPRLDGPDDSDFDQIRGLIEYISQLYRNGAISAIRYVGGKSIGEALDLLADDSRIITAADSIDLAFTPQFGFIIESREQLNGRIIANYS